MKNIALHDKGPPKTLHCPFKSQFFWLPLLISSFVLNPFYLNSSTDAYPDIAPLLRLKNQNILIYDKDTLDIESSYVSINLLEIISDTLAIYEVKFSFRTILSKPRFLNGFSSFTLLAGFDQEKLKSEFPFCQRIPHIPNGLYTLHDEGMHQPDSMLWKKNSAKFSSINGYKEHKIVKGQLHINSHRGFTTIVIVYQLSNGKILSGRLSKDSLNIWYNTGLDLKICNEWRIVLQMQRIVLLIFLFAVFVLPRFLKKPKQVKGW